MEETITSRFIESIRELSKENIPESVFDEFKNSFADYISCAYAGSSVMYNKVL